MVRGHQRAQQRAVLIRGATEHGLKPPVAAQIRPFIDADHQVTVTNVESQQHARSLWSQRRSATEERPKRTRKRERAKTRKGITWDRAYRTLDCVFSFLRVFALSRFRVLSVRRAGRLRQC